ncbi:MAG: protein-disulfide reductase DsbD domain-containing protein [Chloroflexia bacterium]
MKKTFLLSSALLLVSSCFAQSITAVSIDPVQRVTVERGKSSTIKVHAKVAQGYHVNSNKPHEDYLIPMRVTLTADPLVAEAIKYPAGHDEKYEFSEKPLNVITGDFDLMITVKAPATIEPQMQVLLGKLRYQACSDKACLAPKTLEFRITADIR